MLESHFQSTKIEAGCDEAGRGCLAGPVVAAAVIFAPDYENNLLNDSKKLTEKQREKLQETIKCDALAWAIGICNNNEIDEINILNASFKAMHRAIDDLKLKPEYLIIDGNRFTKYGDIPHSCIIKGDGKFLSIAAASILAKTTRDKMMIELHQEFPQYSWDKNKGYPTKDHVKGIQKTGYSIYHRKTFHLKQQLKLEF